MYFRRCALYNSLC